MKRKHVAGLVVGLTVIVLVPLAWRGEVVSLASRAMLDRLPDREADRTTGTARPDRSAVQREAGVSHIAMPDDRAVPANEQDLLELVAWMRGLDHEDLLRLSNAEFDFEESELLEMLRELEGAWVVQALGDLAIAENDPLLKAILVEGLVGGAPSFERLDHAGLIPILDTLMSDMSRAADDPYDVARNLAMAAYGACARGDQDYATLMSEHLATSDNRGFLFHGYLFMGRVPEGKAILEQMLSAHESPDGRLGALEGLRHSSYMEPHQITTAGLAALEVETSERNRLLIYEMVISKGGEAALTAVEQMLRAGQIAEIDKTVELLAMEMAPERATALFQDMLRDHDLAGPAQQAVYNAMGLVEGPEGAAFLLEMARNEELDPGDRLAGLRGLWNAPVDEQRAVELRDIFENGDDPALRTEAMRMLAYGETGGDGLDMRAIAALDDDPSVRAEAVQLAAMQPSGDTREWLEDRLMQDESMDVKAAALGALVFQAHYTGDGDAVLGYLGQARRLTDDDSVRAMVDEGERMVKDYDERNLELGLAEEAEFWGTVARYTDGPASRSFQRQADQLGRIVSSLRMAMDERRPPR